jgi:hypothetical protein
MRWQVEHSNVRSSKPRFPAEIRASLKLCLQIGHMGRPIVKAKLLTAPPPLKVSPADNVMSIPKSRRRPKHGRSLLRWKCRKGSKDGSTGEIVRAVFCFNYRRD